MTKKVSLEIKDGAVEFNIDTNADGESVVKGKLNIGEAIEEAFKREGAIEGAKVVDFKFNGGKLELKIDTDKDGEELLTLSIDLGEVFDEVKDMLSKKDDSDNE